VLEANLVRIRKIICPVDFFPPSEAALSYATSLAKEYDARLHILHVIPPVSSILDFTQDTGKLVKAAHNESQLRLAKMAKTVKGSGVNASVEIRFGEIDREILNAIDEYKANLIVAGTHGRRGFQHWLIGSVCERLLRKVPIPILTIGHTKRACRSSKHQADLGCHRLFGRKY
jgi:nucleotide-binding universal stress UspA family protein